MYDLEPTDIRIQRDGNCNIVTIAFDDFSGMIIRMDPTSSRLTEIETVRGRNCIKSYEFADKFFQHFGPDSETAFKRLNIFIKRFILCQ
jgi:hypothetical protein